MTDTPTPETADVDPEERPGTAAEEAGIVDQQAAVLEDIVEDIESDPGEATA